jgi:hypothetical protein
MIVERVIFLNRAIRAKTFLLYFLVLMYHLMIFILIPRRQEKTFLELPTLVFFYLLKLLSFLLSALQIKDG